MWNYRYLPAAVTERDALTPREKGALINAGAKLAALGPEAQADARGFAAACRRAEARLAKIEEEGR